MAKKATINPTKDELAIRNIGRIKTLKLAIEKAKARGQTERLQSLHAEFDRRMAEANKLKAELESL